MLIYLDKELTSKEKRKAIRYMKQYNKLDAIIKSKESTLLPSHTVSYEEKPSQSVREFSSEAEDYTIRSVEIDEYRNAKKILDIAYESSNYMQKIIWEKHFIDNVRDTDIYYEPEYKINRKRYYQEKRELINFVAECLRVGQISHN